MAGADDVVKAALKLIAGGAKEAGPSVAERAAKNIDVFNTANRLGVDTNDIAKLQETKRLMDYHKGFMGDVRERAQSLAELQRQMQEQGAFPMEVGTRFTTPHSQKFGHPPHIVTGYYVDPKNPSGRYGYRVRQEHADGNVTEQMLMIRDPKLEALHGPEKWEELQRGFVPMTGPKVVKASGGSIREGYGPGGWVDDVVKMAGKVIEGEGDNVTRLSDVKSARARDALIKQLKSSINQVKSGYFQAGRQALINQKSLDLHKSGMLPLQQGTIVTPPSTWDMPGDWRVSGYWYDEKDPRRFGYRLQNESGQTYDAAASDPRAGLKHDNPYSFGAGFKAYAGPNAAPPKPVASPVEKPAAIPKPPEVLDAINKEYEDLFGSEDPFKPKAHGGRIAKGPGGWIDDVVKMAGKVISGEGEDAAKAGIRAYHGTPQPTENLIDLFHGTTPEAFDAITSSGNIFGSSRFSPRRDVAETFAHNVGGNANTVVKVKAPASSLMVDLDLPAAKLLTPDEAAAYLDKPDWTILDFIENGYSVGVPDTSVLSIDRAVGGRIAKGPGGWLDDVVRMAGKVISGEGEEAAKTGIRAYQGSPHNFAAERLVRFPEGRTEYIVGQPDVLPDVPQGAEVLQDFPLGRMRMDKIGTGEGAQAYGHGLYAAENERVAKGYRDALTPKNYLLNAPEPEIAAKHGQDVLDMLHYHGGDPNDLQETINRLKEQNKRDLLDLGLSDVSQVKPQNDWGIEANVVNRADRINRLQGLLASPDVKVNPGHMYEVNIAANPEQFLDWDKPLSEQSEAVKNAFRSMDIADESVWPNITANDAYEMLRVDSMGDDAFLRDQAYRLARRAEAGAGASRMLREAGIPGIKYLDAGSRGAGDGTRNYVVFDDKLISIIRKYGIAGASAMLGYNLMEQLDPKQALAASMADQDYQASRPQRSMGGNNSISGALNVARGLNGGE